MPQELVIGIDLGTTNTCAAVVIEGEIHVIPDENERRTQASVVSFLEDGSLIAGSEARRGLVGSPESTLFSLKRLIGRDLREEFVQQTLKHLPYQVEPGPTGAPMVRIQGQLLALPEISAMLLRRMRDLAEGHLKRPIKKAVITVPANFDDRQRQMTRLAGRLAGFEVLRILNEPTAAALAYGFGQGYQARIAIYDFGGGTFDITLLEIQESIFEVLSTAGDPFLGGDDFDHRLAHFMQIAFKQQHGQDLQDLPLARARLKQVAERVKIELSRKERAIVNIHELGLAEDGSALGLRFRLDRRSIEQRFEEIIERSFHICDQALESAKLKPQDIDGVVLVGGSTRMPLIQRMVSSYFGSPALSNINPDEVVAVGAAIEGASLEANPFQDGEQPLLIDVTPHSLGIQTVGGLYEILIPRNAIVPCEQSRVFSTTSDRQSVVRIQIFQGEHSHAAHNTKLGELEFYDLRLGPRGSVEIEVIFEINTDGIVEVTARDRETSMAQNLRIQIAADHSPQEIEEMMKRA